MTRDNDSERRKRLASERLKDSLAGIHARTYISKHPDVCKAARVMCGMSQSGMGALLFDDQIADDGDIKKQLDVARVTIARYESGKSVPPADIALKYLAYLRMLCEAAGSSLEEVAGKALAARTVPSSAPVRTAVMSTSSGKRKPS